MSQTNEIIGYRVFHEPTGEFVHHNEHGNFLAPEEPTPISQGDALRRLAALIDTDEGAFFEDFTVRAVYRELTPIESAASELGERLEALCQRHGINLGLGRAEVERQIARELATFSGEPASVIAKFMR